MNIFGKIQKDNRHKDVILILVTPIEGRQFADWKMAFLNLDNEIAKRESGLSDFLRADFKSDEFRDNPHLAYKMLLSFKENLR